jgi:subtilisin family serine protease
LGDAPLVINLSFGGHDHDVAEQAAIDYAIANGVVVVGGAEDRGDAGMRFPGAYPPVISVGNAGWVGQLPPDDPTFIEWILRDVPEDDPSQYFIDLNSGRELAGQDLDVVAPGTWVPVAGTQNGLVNYTFRTTTRLACPHVTGVVALMLQKNPGLTQSDIEGILESTALPIAAGCADISEVGVSPGNQPTWGDHDNVFFLEVPVTVCWDANATGYGLVQADVALAATPLP